MALIRCLFLMGVFALPFQNADAQPPARSASASDLTKDRESCFQQARSSWNFTADGEAYLRSYELGRISFEIVTVRFNVGPEGLALRNKYLNPADVQLSTADQAAKIRSNPRAIREFANLATRFAAPYRGSAPGAGLTYEACIANAEAAQLERGATGTITKSAPTAPPRVAPITVYGAGKALSDNICKSELANMQAEWRKLGQNGPDISYYYETWSKFDAVVVQRQVQRNAGQEQGVVARRDDTPQYRATNLWEDCLLRTRSAQVSGSNTTNQTANAKSAIDLPKSAIDIPKSAIDIAKRDAVSALDQALASSPSAGLNKALDAHRARPEEPGEDASSCLQLRPYGGPGDDDQLFNICGYVVEALWCVEGVDCKPSYSNMQSIFPGRSYGMGGTGDGQGRTVRWAGCRGRNSIRGGSAPFTHVCKKAPEA